MTRLRDLPSACLLEIGHDGAHKFGPRSSRTLRFGARCHADDVCRPRRATAEPRYGRTHTGQPAKVSIVEDPQND